MSLLVLVYKIFLGYESQDHPGQSSSGLSNEASSGIIGLVPTSDGVRCLSCGKTLSTMSSAKRHYTLVHATNKGAIF